MIESPGELQRVRGNENINGESMIRTKWTIRMGILAAVVVSAAVLAISACGDANKEGTVATPSAATTGTAPVMTGDHANEEVCKTLTLQGELFERFAKLDMDDVAGRAKYFADQKSLNATLVNTAPASLASDVAFQTRNANAMIDAQMAKDPAGIKAAAALLRSPENIAASRRIADYCGVTLPR